MKRPTLRQAFVVLLIVSALLLGAVFALLLESSRRSVLASAEALRDAASRRAAAAVDTYLRQAEAPLAEVEADLHNGLVDGDDAVEMERRLLSASLSNMGLAEVTFTHADPSWQVSLVRQGEGAAELHARHTRYKDGRWRMAVRRTGGGPLLSAPLSDLNEPAADPTAHLTFVTPAGAAYGRTIWTDLHYAEADAGRPPAERRVVVTVMKSVENLSGRFIGVLRAGLRAEQLDAVTRFRVDETRDDDPHRVFLADETGRLLTRLSPSDRLHESGEDVRVEPAMIPKEIAAALRRPELAAVDEEAPVARAAFDVDAARYLVTFRRLGGTQGWRVGVLVPESHYTAGLVRARNRVLLATAGLFLLVVGAGVAVLRSVQRGLRGVVDATGRMENFDFQPAVTIARFRDLDDVHQRLERAKTALRALGRYVPIDLVRLLYTSGREPTLGGALTDVSMMFTDIKDFTTLAESLPADEVAALLGRYLAVMTRGVHETGGIVDKYIGDAVMALWNVPVRVKEHPRSACEAALACRQATEALFASPEWSGQPAWATRFGIHCDRVMVGHFGAPDRMSYTAMGDGVNVAARLEGLNKHYKTTILVGQAVRDAAGDGFRFRLVDVVAVKGRRGGLRIYELLNHGDASPDLVAGYERAFAAYQSRRFEDAIRLLEPLQGDGPSTTLAARCRALLVEPPPADWDGVHQWVVK